jgi:MEMO1 family protein
MAADTRHALFAGRWYPSSSSELGALVDTYLASASPPRGAVAGAVAPHAGLMYSGPVAGHTYAALRGSDAEAAVLVGPSHYVAFSGCAVPASRWFASPLGPLAIDTELVQAIADASGWVHVDDAVHAREHSLELQLPFLARVCPALPLVPILMGRQDRQTVEGLATVLARVLDGRRVVVIASSALSHYQDRATASALDRVVLDRLEAFDAGGLMDQLEHAPDHACGGGPIVVTMRVARALGASAGRVLHYGDSGDVSGDTSEVVGYVSAAFGSFDDKPAG